MFSDLYREGNRSILIAYVTKIIGKTIRNYTFRKPSPWKTLFLTHRILTIKQILDNGRICHWATKLTNLYLMFFRLLMWYYT